MKLWKYRSENHKEKFLLRYKIQKGGVLRKYKKGLQKSRLYYRLITANYSPVKNYPAGIIKPLFALPNPVLKEVRPNEYALIDGVILIDKKKKNEEKK